MASSVFPLTGLQHQITTTLTNTQILNLPPSEGVQIIAAPGANKVIIPCGGALVLTVAAGGTYTASDDPGLALTYSGTTPGATVYIGDNTFLTSATAPRVSIASMSAWNLAAGSGDFLGHLRSDPFLTSAAADKAIILYDDDNNGGSAYGGGNAANTLAVTVSYYLFDLSSLAFV